MWRAVRYCVLVLVACAHQAKTFPCDGPSWRPLTTEHGGAVPSLSRPDGAIASVRIVGASPALTETLRPQLASKAGVRLADAPLGTDVRTLWALGIFSDVRVEATQAAKGVDVAFVVQPQPLIDAVAIRGGGRDTPEVRRLRMLTGLPYEPRRILRMAETIAREYRRDGHLDAHVAVRRSPQGVSLCVAAEPGPRVTIGAIKFPGRTAIAERVLAEKVGKGEVNRVGGIYDPDGFERDLLLLAYEYYEHGYANARVDPPVAVRRGDRLVIEIPIKEGPQFRFGAVSIVGPLRFERSAIAPGELFSPTRVRTEIARLEKRYPRANVVPLTKVDLATRRIAMTLEIEWEYPWDVLRSLQ